MVLLPDSTVLTQLHRLIYTAPSRLILLFIGVLSVLLFTYTPRASMKLPTPNDLDSKISDIQVKDQYAISQAISIHNPNLLRNPKFRPRLSPHLLNLYPFRQLRQRQPIPLPINLKNTQIRNNRTHYPRPRQRQVALFHNLRAPILRYMVRRDYNLRLVWV